MIEEAFSLKTMMVSEMLTIIDELNIVITTYVYVGAYFTERYISHNEDVGNVEVCVSYISRDDLPQTVNVSINSQADYGKYI